MFEVVASGVVSSESETRNFLGSTLLAAQEGECSWGEIEKEILKSTFKYLVDNSLAVQTRKETSC